MTNVPRAVSQAWNSSLTYPGSGTTRSSCLSLVLYWRRPGGFHDVTSRRRDVTDSEWKLDLVRVDSAGSQLSYEWSSANTRQIQQFQSATYSWRSSRQTTMSLGSFIPSTWIPSLNVLNVSTAYILMTGDLWQTAYMILSSCAIPETLATTCIQHARLTVNIPFLTIRAPQIRQFFHCHSPVGARDVKLPGPPYIDILASLSTIGWCPENFENVISLTVQEIRCWQTVSQSATNRRYLKQCTLDTVRSLPFFLLHCKLTECVDVSRNTRNTLLSNLHKYNISIFEVTLCLPLCKINVFISYTIMSIAV